MGLEMAVFVGRPVPTPPHLDSKKGGFWVILGSRRLSQTPVLEPRTWVWKWRFALENLFHPPFIWALKMGLNRDFGLWVQAPFPDPVLEPRVGLEMSVFVLVPTPPPWSGLQKWGGGGSWFGVILGSKRLSQTLSLRTWVWKWRLSSKNLFQPPIWALKMGVGNRGFGLFWAPGAFRRPPFSSRNLGLGRLSLENVGKPVPTPPPHLGSKNEVGNRGFRHLFQTPVLEPRTWVWKRRWESWFWVDLGSKASVPDPSF